MTPPLPFVATLDDAARRAWLAALRAALPGERLVDLDELSDAERASVDVAIVANPPPQALRGLPRLRWVHSVWAGVERLLGEWPDGHLHIVRLVDPQLADTMAEAVLAWTLYLHRDMPRYAEQQRQRVWQPLEWVRAQDRVVGVLGLGHLGEAAARRLAASGFAVEGWSRSAKDLAGVRCHSGEAGLRALLGRAQLLVSLLPLTPATQGLLDRDAFAALPAGAGFINFSRGAIADDAALRQALDSGHLSHAVLDVFTTEPLPPPSWQWGHPRVTVLPHISAPTHRGTAAAIVARHITAYRRSGALPPGVDRQQGY